MYWLFRVTFVLVSIEYIFANMSKFNAKEFVESDLSLEKVESLIKSDLIQLADFVKLHFDKSSKKAVIRKLVIRELVSCDLLDESVLDSVDAKESNEFEIAKLQIKLKEKEMELQFKADSEEREFKLRQLELENQQKAIE